MTDLAEHKPEAEAMASVEEIQGRAQWYRLLAGVFAEEPSAEFLDSLLGDSSMEALAPLGVTFDDDVLACSREALLDELAAEYTMLFVAPGAFPPVESVRLQGGYAQTASIEVRNAYANEGFVVESGRFKMFDDHLAAELQFVAALLERQVDALNDGDASEARRLEKVIKRFWFQHLGRWLRGYATLIHDASELSFYREMGALLGRFAEAEVDYLGIDVVDIDGGRWRAPKPEEMDQPMMCGGGSEQA